MPTNSSFDPYTQWFEITLIDGTSKMEASVAHINTLRRLGVWVAISQGAQIGAAAILLTAIVLMTKSAKRRSWVFILNALSLLLVVIRGIFQLAVVTGPFYEFFRWETNHYADIGHAKAVSVCGEVSAFLLTLAIEVSLFLQVRIVCCNLSNPRRVLVNLFNGLLISAAVCMRFVVMVLSVHWGIINLEKQGEEQFQLINKTASAANICLVISIGMSTIIFTAKLALAIRSRRSMGMKQFGPMQIIFIMGCQTMFTPRTYYVIVLLDTRC